MYRTACTCVAVLSPVSCCSPSSGTRLLLTSKPVTVSLCPQIYWSTARMPLSGKCSFFLKKKKQITYMCLIPFPKIICFWTWQCFLGWCVGYDNGHTMLHFWAWPNNFWIMSFSVCFSGHFHHTPVPVDYTEHLRINVYLQFVFSAQCQYLMSLHFWTRKTSTVFLLCLFSRWQHILTCFRSSFAHFEAELVAYMQSLKC